MQIRLEVKINIIFGVGPFWLNLAPLYMFRPLSSREIRCAISALENEEVNPLFFSQWYKDQKVAVFHAFPEFIKLINKFLFK
jgi:hypothetical protein